MILRNTTESGERSVRHRPLCRSRGTATKQWRYQWSREKCFVSAPLRPARSIRTAPSGSNTV